MTSTNSSNFIGRARLSRALLLACIAGTLGTGAAARGQVTTAQWLSAVSGNWTDPTLWTTNPFYPNNANGNPLYRAEFLATGSNYTATLNSNIALDSLLLNSANATIAHTGGTLTLGGTATLTAGTFSLNGGTIAGGTIDNTASKLVISNNVGNTLSGVSILGGLNINSNLAKLKILGDLSATGTVNVNGSTNSLSFMNSGSFSGGTINLSGSASVNFLTIEGNSTFTLASGAAITGRSARIGTQSYTSGSNAFVNSGTVTASGSGILFISSASFTNLGTAQASSSGSLTIDSANWSSSGTLRANTGSGLNLGGNWSSSGAIIVNGGTLTMGGTFSTTGLNVSYTSGTVNLTGIANNAGNTLAFNAGTGSWALNGGTINGGVLSFAAGQQLNIGSSTCTLNNVSVLGDWTPATGSMDLNVQGAFTTSGALRLNSAVVQQNVNFSAAAVDTDIELSGFAKRLRFTNNSTLAIGSSVTALSGSHTIDGAGTLVQNGTVRASGAGTFLNVRPGTIVNNGLIRVDTGANLTLGVTDAAVPTAFNNLGAIQVDNATLTLSGNFATANLGSISRTGGTINFTGNVNNSSATLDLSARGGTWNLVNFSNPTISGGNLVLSPAGTFAFTDRSSLTLTNVNVSGDLAVTGGSQSGNENNLFLSGTIGLAGTVSFVGPFAGGTFLGNTSLNGGTYAFNSASGGNSLLTQAASTLTVGATTTIRGGRATLGGAGDIVFNGHAIADVAGAVLGIGGSGTASINGVCDVLGGSLALGSTNTCTLNGTINMQGGALSFGSTVGTVLGSNFVLNRQGGTVTVSGVLDNTGRTLNLNASTGSWNLYGANGASTLRGGTLNLSGGSQFFRGKYDNVTVNGDFTVRNGDIVTIFNRMDLNGQITMVDGSQLNFDALVNQPSTRFDTGTIRMVLANSERASITCGGNAPTIIGEQATIIAGGLIGGNRNASIGSFASTLYNRGTINCIAGKEVYLLSGHLFNEGVLRAQSGGLLRVAWDNLATWANSGEIIADGGTVLITGKGSTATLGTIRSINLGRILLGGSIDNSGHTLAVNDFTGSYTLATGQIKGGHVSSSGSARFLMGSSQGGSNILDGVTFDQDLVIDTASNSVLVRNFLDVNGSVKLNATASLAFQGNQTFAKTIEFAGSSVGAVSVSAGIGPASTLTLASSSLIRGGNGRLLTSANSTIVNRGTISADVNGKSIQIYLQRFFNEGTIQAINGGFLTFIPPPGAESDAGTLINSGILSLAGPTSMYGSIVQTLSGRTSLTLTDEALESLSVLSIQGSADFSGTVAVLLSEGLALHQGEVIHLITSDHLRWNTDSTLVLPELRGALLWDRQHVESGVLKVIPAPGVLSLTLVGLCAAARRRRR